MNDVIFKAITSYHELPPNCDISWIDLFNKYLSPETKRFAEKNGLHLNVLAELLSQTVEEANGDKALLDGILMGKLKDPSAIESAARKYNVKAFPSR